MHIQFLGGATTVTVGTLVTAAPAQPVQLTVHHLPPGVSATPAATVITAGGAATVRLTTSPGTPPGTYVVTFTAQGTGDARETTFTLSVVATGPG